jgi:uncharacterized phage protein (TIGR02220 family)
MTEAFSRHGKGPLKHTDGRMKLIRARLAEGFKPEDFARAVDGYQRLYRGKKDFDSAAYFTPETLLAAKNFAKYVESAPNGSSGTEVSQEDLNRIFSQKVNPW